jgi:hypothetical protein
MKRLLITSLVSLSILAACNKDRKFDDYKYTTVYFPYQSPVRTIVLGEDIYDNTLDNLHQFSIMATMGGVYENKKNVTLDVAIDTTLTRNLRYDSANGAAVIAMPANYYTIPSKDMKITIPAGQIMGGINIQLTDAYFADPRSISRTFVMPLKIKSVTNADSILRGNSNLTSPDPRKAGDWNTVPKDYVLYAVKYINPYHGIYLRRGIDQVKGSGGNTALDTNIVYHNAYVEQDQLAYLYTKTLTQDTINLTTRVKGSAINVPFQIRLNFANNNSCTVSGPASTGYTVTGTGSFVKKGDMWGNEKRDVIYLNYKVDFGTVVHNLTDTLVLRDRGVSFQMFSSVVN